METKLNLTREEKIDLIKEAFLGSVKREKISDKSGGYQAYLRSSFGKFEELNIPRTPGCEIIIIPNDMREKRELTIGDTASAFAEPGLLAGLQLKLTELPSQPILHKQIGVINPKIGRGLHSILTRTKKGNAGWATETGEAEGIVEPEFKSSVTPNYRRLEMSFNISRMAALYAPEQIKEILFKEIFDDLDYELDKGIFHGTGVDPYVKGLEVHEDVSQIDGSNFSFSKAVTMRKTAKNNDAGFNSFYLLNPNDEADLCERPLRAGSDRFIIENNKMNGVPVLSSTAILEGKIFHGDFSTVVVTELDPGVILIINPFTAGATKVSIVAVRFVDVYVRNPKSIVRAVNLD